MPLDAETGTVEFWYEWFSAIIWWIFTIILGALCAVHYRKTYQDLYTEERLSISHRVKKSKIKTFYKAGHYLTCIASFCYFLISFSIAILFNFSYDNHCNYLVMPQLMLFMLGKSTVYVLFLLRLHIVYRSTTYKYSKRTLWILFGIIVGVTLIIWIDQIVSYLEVGNGIEMIYYLSVEEYPHYCQYTAPYYVLGMLFPVYKFAENFVIYTHFRKITYLAPMFMYDLVMTILNIFLFVSPLRKLLKDIEKTGGGTNKTSEMMIATAYKYTILTSITSLTTMTFLLLIIGSALADLAGFDMIINTICIFLLCPYYPDTKYYSVYCCLCIRCCDRSNYSSVTKAMLEKTATDGVDGQDTRTTNLEPTATSQTAPTISSGQTNTDTNNTITSFHKSSLAGNQTVPGHEEDDNAQTPVAMTPHDQGVVSDFEEP